MRPSPFSRALRCSSTLGAALLCGLFGAACAHSSDAEPMLPAQPESFSYQAAPAQPEPAPEPARPRLSRTVTLGRGENNAAYTVPRPVTAPPPGPNVVVQNNVVTAPPVYYGGYPVGYGYGYGSRGLERDGMIGGTRVPSTQWGSTGWEGSRRTAAPGQTPGVGGNWPTPPSYGPSPMR